MKSLSFPFRLTSTKLVAETQSYPEVVRAQVIDALMTNQGERLFRPRYGCDVQTALFDPRDELVRRDAAAMIQTKLEELVPRAQVVEISVEPVQDEAVVMVYISYRVSPFSTDIELSLPISSAEFTEFQALAPEVPDV